MIINLQRNGLFTKEHTTELKPTDKGKLAIVSGSALSFNHRNPETQLFIIYDITAYDGKTNSYKVWGEYVVDGQTSTIPYSSITGVLKNEELKTILDTAKLDESTYYTLVDYLATENEKNAYRLTNKTMTVEEYLNRVLEIEDVDEQAEELKKLPDRMAISDYNMKIIKHIVEETYINNDALSEDWVVAYNKLVGIKDTSKDYYYMDNDDTFRNITEDDIINLVNELKKLK